MIMYFIYWLGAHNNMRWFRNIIYYITDRPLWGITQLIADMKGLGGRSIKNKEEEFDSKKFKEAIDEFLEKYDYNN